MIPIKYSLKKTIKIIFVMFFYLAVEIAILHLNDNCLLKNNHIIMSLGSLFNTLGTAYLANVMLQSEGNIKVDSCCVYRKGEFFCFRYWTVLPRGQFVYDVEISIKLMDDTINRSGVNRVAAYWDSYNAIDKAPYSLRRIRGNRFVNIENKDENIIRSIIVSNKDKWDRLYFLLTIQAHLSDGTIVSVSQKYDIKSALLTQYMFAPTGKNRFTFELYKKSVEMYDVRLLDVISKTDFYFWNADNSGRYYKNGIRYDAFDCINDNMPSLENMLELEEVVLGKNYRMKLLRNLGSAMILKDKRFSFWKVAKSHKELKRRLKQWKH